MRTLPRQLSKCAPARIGKLSVLPIFVDLRGKRAVVAGGSEAARWKAELLAAAGAEVHVYVRTQELCDQLRLFLERETPGAGLVHHDRDWGEDVFEGAAIAVADASSEEEARRFHQCAVVAGVPVNVIDRPEFCQFQFGSIVNRSPVVVGISTSGAAPILAQAIRRRIETLLPASLAAWAAWAQAMRTALHDRLRAGAPRRAFWEHFVDRAFSRQFSDRDARDLLLEADRIASHVDQSKGRVIVIGVSGDADLLTLKAARALYAADVVLYDDFVSDQVLELARREATRILVETHRSHEIRRQEDLDQLMVELVTAGKRVVRLVSGASTYAEVAQIERDGGAARIMAGVPAMSFDEFARGAPSL
jgi:uroporphyrin-III C-methyltransferase/precorrin-2 dehydrogenase/sirohydrochlorin ferrochelatase